MVKRKKVAVIGGGVSGLAATKAFLDKGHDVHAFERTADIGGVWEPSRSYPDVQTQSPKDLYRYTDQAMPDDYPEWPKGPQVHAYLHDYAKKRALLERYRLNTCITTMTRRADGAAGWTLTIEDDAGERAEDFDFVAVCTGQFSDKKTLTHPGQSDFEARGGTVLHSSDYTDPEMARGKRVVVLGFSKSATDIAVNAAANGASSVAIVYRKPVWRVPYFVGGINFKHLLYMRAQEMQFNGWDPSPVARLVRLLAAPLIWANFRGLETLLKLQLGLGRYGMVPDVRIEKDVSCSVPIVTPGFFEGLKDGSIVPYRGTIDRYEGDGVVVTGEKPVGADIVVLAVGWRLGVPFLDPAYKARLVEPDGQYRIYRLIANPDLPDMGFVGFNSSFCTVLSAEMAAHWLVRYADGMLARQPSPAEMTRSIESLLHWRREERPAAKVYGGLCSAPFHFRHFDELLEDIGATKRARDNPFAEYFSYPDADAYGDFLASAPDYRAEPA